jgi:hypothetical protein
VVSAAAVLMSVVLMSLVPILGPAGTDDACPDTLISTTQQPDRFRAETLWFFAPSGHSPVSTSWSNDASLGGDFTLVHDRIQMRFGVNISHAYSSSATTSFFIPAHERGRIGSRYNVWTNRINVRDWNGRTCNPPRTETRIAKHLVRFEAQIRPATRPPDH